MQTKKNVTVTKAIQVGMRKIIFSSLTIFILLLMASFPMMIFLPLHPGISLLLAFVVATLAAWLWSGYFVVGWKFWAIEHVQDIFKLEARARQRGFIYRLDKIGDLEIASQAERLRYKKLYEQAAKNWSEESVEDIDLPYETIIRYSWWTQLPSIIFLGFGVYLLIGDTQMPIDNIVFGVLLIGVPGYLLMRFANKVEQENYLRINATEIQFEGYHPIKWNEIRNTAIIRQGVGKSTRFYFVINVQDIEYKWLLEIDNLSVSQLEHLLDVYQTRFKKSADQSFYKV